MLSFLKDALLTSTSILEEDTRSKPDLLDYRCIRKVCALMLKFLVYLQKTTWPWCCASLLSLNKDSNSWAFSTESYGETDLSWGLFSVGDSIPSWKYYDKMMKIQRSRSLPLLRDIQGKVLWIMCPSLWILLHTYVPCPMYCSLPITYKLQE